jgi:RNA polymerase-binding transcription factor DksA
VNQIKQRRKLERMLAKLGRRHLAFERGMRREDGGVEADLAEQAGTLESDALLACLQEEGEEQGVKVLAALRRLEQGTYGVCQDCQLEIGDARLEALPYAETCISCARERERSG